MPRNPDNLSRDSPSNGVPEPVSAFRFPTSAFPSLWLSQQLRPYGIRPKTIRVGELTSKGYLKAEFIEVFHRYIPASEIQVLLEPGS
jgi:hypothetical protein